MIQVRREPINFFCYGAMLLIPHIKIFSFLRTEYINLQKEQFTK